MFIGSLVLFLSSLFIIAKTSTPVINSIFGTKLAPPEDVEFSYNKVMVLVAVIIGILTAFTQYLKYKNTERGFILKKIALPTLLAAIIVGLLAVFYPFVYYKQGPGFLGAMYVALFATVYTVVANATYIFSGLHGKLKAAGASVSHLGFGLMIAGMLISAGNKKVISEEKYKAFSLPVGIDPLTKKEDIAAENINLIRQVPNRMGDYDVTYLNDSVGNETGRRYYKLQFERKDPVTKKTTENFFLTPDVYLMKDNNMSSNPDTKNYLTHDVFTYISYALNPEKNIDTTQFKIHEVADGDTIFYSKGYMVLNKVIKNPESNKFKIIPKGPSVMADISITTLDSQHYKAFPMLLIDSNAIRQADDTVYAQNLFVQFAGVTTDQRKIKIGIKESDKMIDFVTLKAYIFPYINLVWIGLILMAVGFVMSIIRRAGLSPLAGGAALLFTAAALFYMFLLAN
jgi:cytochrome c-type biogenesis protein CcmF